MSDAATTDRLRAWWLALAALTLLAVGLRLWQLDSAPAGLNVDEAAEGLMALEILRGARPVFFSSYTGQEAGYMYLVAAAIAALGQNALAVRLPAALAGVLLVPAVALLTRRAYGPWAALLAAGACCAAPWLQHMNRIGFRANLLPLALALWGWLVLRALDGSTLNRRDAEKDRNRRDAEDAEDAERADASGAPVPPSGGAAPAPKRADASGAPVPPSGGAAPAPKRADASAAPLLPWLLPGLILGLSAYTYLAARVVPLLALLFLGYLWLRHRPLARAVTPGYLLMLAVAALVALPLALHFLRVPADWTARTGQVFVCSGLDASPCAGRIADHTLRTLLMPLWAGDPKPFYNLDAGPALPWFVGWLVFPGALLALRRGGPANTLLLLWCAVMALPGVLSSESPSFIRTLGAAPAVLALWGLGVLSLAEPQSRRTAEPQTRPQGSEVPWFGAPKVPRFRGSEVPWFRGSVVPWFRGSVVPWFRGSVVPWFGAPKVPRFRGSAVPRFRGSVVPWFRGSVVPWFRGSVVILAMTAHTAYGYFGRWAVDPERYYDYNAYAAETARAAAATSPNTALYISEEYYRHATYLYLAPRTAAARWFDARVGWPLAPGPAVYFLPFTTPVDPAFVTPLTAGAAGTNMVNPAGQYAYTRLAFAKPADAPTPAILLRETLGPLLLKGATVSSTDQLRVTLHLQVLDETGRELRLFVHLLDQNGRIVAQQDALGVPAAEWQLGERFLSFHALGPLPADQGELRLVAGIYDVFTGERLPAIGPHAAGDVVTLWTR